MFEKVEVFVFDNLQMIFDQFGWWGVMVLMAFENTTGITPSEVLLGLAGWMLIEAHGLPFSFVFVGGLYAALGSLVGSSLTYWLVRLGGRPLVERVARGVRFPRGHLDRTEILFQRWGVKAVFWGRVIPGVRVLITIPAGLTRMDYPTFAGVTFAGAYLWCTILLGVGYVFGHEWPLVSEILYQFAPYLLGVFFLAMLVVGGWLYWMQLHKVLRATPMASMD
ncbi:MAG: DedA family protein [Anaerolineales bacterium]|nr:DedA family protein [Anaerolineales bacterium]